MTSHKLLKLFLRLAIGLAFLSAVGDRFGFWSYQVAWGDWDSFVTYNHTLVPWVQGTTLQIVAATATIAETLFGIFLIIGFKTTFFARLSGVLLLLFALSMTFTIGIKPAFDFSVYASSGAAFALGTMKEKFLEIDMLF